MDENTPEEQQNRPTPEMRELAGRMVLDEAGEGNFSAAAELKAFAETAEPLPWNRSAADLAAMIRAGQRAGAFPREAKLEVSEAVAEHLRAAGVPEDSFIVRPGGVGVALEDIPAGGTGQMVVGVDPRIEKMLAEDAVYPLRKLELPKPTPEQLGWTSTLRTGKTQAQTDLELAVQLVDAAGPRGPAHDRRIRAAVEQAMAVDLRRLVPQLLHIPLHVEQSIALAGALVEAGWVPGARRRADAVDEVAKAAEDRFKDQPVLDEDGETVIGHVWEVLPRHALKHPREWVAAVDENEKNRPRFSSQEGAVGWVRLHAVRDGRPLTVPYDAEKVLGLKNAVIGWVWLDPEHAGVDGRWLAVHGSHPEHRHPLFGIRNGAPGPDARNQAIGWVLEQDREARR